MLRTNFQKMFRYSILVMAFIVCSSCSSKSASNVFNFEYEWYDKKDFADYEKDLRGFPLRDGQVLELNELLDFALTSVSEYHQNKEQDKYNLAAYLKEHFIDMIGDDGFILPYYNSVTSNNVPLVNAEIQAKLLCFFLRIEEDEQLSDFRINDVIKRIAKTFTFEIGGQVKWLLYRDQDWMWFEKYPGTNNHDLGGAWLL